MTNQAVTPVTPDTTAQAAAVRRLIETVRKNMCHLPTYTHAEINAAIEATEKGAPR